MTKKAKIPKVRNPFVMHARNRVAGAHVKSKKIQRRDDKVKLKKEVFA